jgi:integrase
MAKRAKAGRGRNTIRNELAPIRCALEQAVEDRKIVENPASLRRGGRRRIPCKEPEQVVAPPAKEVTRMIAAAAGDFRTVLLVAASCGLRLDELYGLRWGDIGKDWLTVTVASSNRRGVLTEPKTKSGKRTVPLFPSARKALKEHKLASRFGADGDLVFPDYFGRPVDSLHVADRALQAAFKAAGLSERAWRFHSLRHFAVSRLIEAGANIVLVSKVAGHATPDITLRVYSHLLDDGVEKAADAFDPASALVREAVG